MAKHFSLDKEPEELLRFNIAPSQMIRAVLALPHSGTPVLRLLKWGLVPSWARDAGIGNRLINARAETMAHKPAFRSAFQQRRCIIPASHFFEWQRLPGGNRQAHCIRLKDGSPMGFAGLWEHWPTPGADDSPPGSLFSCTILTTAANELLAPLHQRMPVILPLESYDAWLNAPSAQVASLPAPWPADTMESWPVSTRVNSPLNDDPTIMEKQKNSLRRNTISDLKEGKASV